jgi:hypothetical protein
MLEGGEDAGLPTAYVEVEDAAYYDYDYACFIDLVLRPCTHMLRA